MTGGVAWSVTWERRSAGRAGDARASAERAGLGYETRGAGPSALRGVGPGVGRGRLGWVWVSYWVSIFLFFFSISNSNKV